MFQRGSRGLWVTEIANRRICHRHTEKNWLKVRSQSQQRDANRAASQMRRPATLRLFLFGVISVGTNGESQNDSLLMKERRTPGLMGNVSKYCVFTRRIAFSTRKLIISCSCADRCGRLVHICLEDACRQLISTESHLRL